MANRADTFNRADASALGTPSDGGSAWVLGTTNGWGVSSNTALAGSSTAYLESSESDGVIQLTTLVAGANLSFLLRYVDSSNYLRCYVTNGFQFFHKLVAGSGTFIGSAGSTGLSSGDVWTVTMSGASLILKKGSTTVCSATESTFSSATKHGVMSDGGSPASIDSWSFTGVGAKLTLTSPKASQVYQRTGDTYGVGGTGTISIAGTNNDTVSQDIEASWNGGSYTTIASSVAAGGSFTGSLTGQPAGSGTLTVRFVASPSDTATVAGVGIGEVFLVMGQSNAPGGAASNYTYTSRYLSPAYPSPSPAFSNGWYYDDTPGMTPSWQDLSAYGAVYNWVATNLTAVLGCPCAFLLFVRGGTNISKWVPTAPVQSGESGTYYAVATSLPGSSKSKSGGPRAVIYHQGESDANGTSQATFYAGLSAIRTALATDLPGTTFLPVKLQNLQSFNSTLSQIQSAAAQVWADTGKNGPDYSSIPTDTNDGLHMNTGPLFQAEGAQVWASLIQAFFTAPTGGSGVTVGRVIGG